MDAVSAHEITFVDDSGAAGTTGKVLIDVNDVEALPEGIFWEGEGENRFTAAATVYIGLKTNTFSTTDSLPAEVHGHFASDGKAVVDTVSVDTSSLSG